MVPMAPKGMGCPRQLVMVEAHGPWHPPFGGEYGRERLAGVAPMAPPNLGFILVSFTSKFANILGSIWLVN